MNVERVGGFAIKGIRRTVENPKASSLTRTQTSRRRRTASARLTGSQVRVASVSP